MVMHFYQQELKFFSDNLKPITPDSIYILAYKYATYATTGRRPIVDKLFRKS